MIFALYIYIYNSIKQLLNKFKLIWKINEPKLNKLSSSMTKLQLFETKSNELSMNFQYSSYVESCYLRGTNRIVYQRYEHLPTYKIQILLSCCFYFLVFLLDLVGCLLAVSQLGCLSALYLFLYVVGCSQLVYERSVTKKKKKVRTHSIQWYPFV